MDTSKRKNLNKVIGTDVAITDTTFKFRIGDEINPNWEWLHLALMRFDKAGFAEKCLPEMYQTGFLSRATKDEAHTLVPLLIHDIDRAVCYGRLDYLDPVLTACVWIFQYYWFRHLGGPQPRTYRNLLGTERRPILPDFKCPICSLKFEAKSVHYDVMCREYLQWQVSHFERVHKLSVGSYTKTKKGGAAKKEKETA